MESVMVTLHMPEKSINAPTLGVAPWTGGSFACFGLLSGAVTVEKLEIHFRDKFLLNSFTAISRFFGVGCTMDERRWGLFFQVVFIQCFVCRYNVDRRCCGPFQIELDCWSKGESRKWTKLEK